MFCAREVSSNLFDDLTYSTRAQIENLRDLLLRSTCGYSGLDLKVTKTLIGHPSACVVGRLYDTNLTLKALHLAFQFLDPVIVLIDLVCHGIHSETKGVVGVVLVSFLAEDQCDQSTPFFSSRQKSLAEV